MFTKLTRSGGHTYVQLVESFRDETGRPRQRTISTLGRLDESKRSINHVPCAASSDVIGVGA